jgi:hypothetical protein
MSPAVGTISNGYYTAPSTISSPQTVVLTATSQGSGVMNGTAVISLMPISAPAPAPVGVSNGPLSLSPASTSVSGGQTANFSALYNGAFTSKVSWSVSPQVGFIQDGVYQAPISIANTQTLTVTATSLSDSTIYATARLTLLGVNGGPASGGGTVFVYPTSAMLSAGQSMPFQAGVMGAANAGVSWSLSPAIGTINNGRYQAPSYIQYSQTVTLTATSLGNPGLTSSVPIYLIGSSGTSTPPPSPSPTTPVTTATSMQLSPTTISLLPQQTAFFSVSTSGGLSTAASWSVVPNMGTVSNGLYTAPASVTSQTTVTVIATSLTDPTKSASASVTLQPSSAPPTSVSITLAPASVSLSANQMTQFTPTVSGTSNTAVTWTVSPALGSVSFGQYTAPSSIANQQAITITATSVADPTKSANAIVMLLPGSVTLSPQSISLAATKSVQFTANVSGASSTAVNWSIAPQMGSISNGLYTAPSTVSSVQNVVVTASSVSDPTKTAQATVSLTPSGSTGISVIPSSVSVAQGQGQQFSASSTGLGGGGVANVTWSLNPQVGSVTSGGFYSAPATISSQQTVVVTASSGGASASANVTLTPPASQPTPPPSSPPSTPPSTPSTITLPLEVIGANGLTVGASFTVGSGANLSGPTTLSMQLHGLRFGGQASVQVNGSGWMNIANGTVTFQGLGGVYGGIGGGFHTLQMTMPIPANVVTTGTNTVTFKFNGTDGNVSGFRVLAFNVLDASGSQLISSSSFVEQDPSTWQPPSTAASDISAGQTLWHTAALNTAAGSPIQAHCADCHSEDGRDLKYFNYSNNSIVARSVFHGLSQQQGNQIASYIRSLNVPNPGRPWNPPYQPGPGTDSQPVANWSAGAGLSAVLDSDGAMQQYLMPGGSTAGWAASASLNMHELPLDLQLPDWNSWLPSVHPIDAFGASFTNNPFNTMYSKLHGELQPNSAAAYQAALNDFNTWGNANGAFLVPMEQNWTQTLTVAVYSAAQWNMVKLWELNQEFGLEGMPQVPFGAKANSRGWYSSQPFFTSPTQLHIPAGPGLGNGTQAVQLYLSQVWYQMQLILNDGQGQERDHSPIDFGYAQGRVKDLSIATNNSTQAMLEMIWLIKALQEETLTGGGPQLGTNGFQPPEVGPTPLGNGGWSMIFTNVSSSTYLSITTAYLNAWFAQISSYTPAQFYQGTDGNGRPWASPTEIPASDDTISTFGGQVWSLLPRFRYLGISPSLTYQISAWAATVWPAGNWALNNAATCTGIGFCTSD